MRLTDSSTELTLQISSQEQNAKAVLLLKGSQHVGQAYVHVLRMCSLLSTEPVGHACAGLGNTIPFLSDPELTATKPDLRRGRALLWPCSLTRQRVLLNDPRGLT